MGTHVSTSAALNGSAVPVVTARGSGVRSRRAWAAWGAVGGAAWAAAALVTWRMDNANPLLGYSGTVAVALAAVSAVLVAITLAGLRLPRVAAWVGWAGPWLVVTGAWALVWQLSTAKLGWLDPPYWAPPQMMVATLHEDGGLLVESTLRSLQLLAIGFGLGATAGFLLGVAMGWSKRVTYWVHPLLRTIGPIPPAALVPIFFVLLPSIWSASVLLIAMAAWFPVTMLTWSGVAAVHRTYYDVARTLGARPRFLVWRVAVPAALPSVFIGLFMGLSLTFITLVIAEMLGAESGLGWYIRWQQQWTAYPAMYTAIVLMIVLFSGLMTVLFRVRDRVLAWQRDLVR